MANFVLSWEITLNSAGNISVSGGDGYIGCVRFGMETSDDEIRRAGGAAYLLLLDRERYSKGIADASDAGGPQQKTDYQLIQEAEQRRRQNQQRVRPPKPPKITATKSPLLVLTLIIIVLGIVGVFAYYYIPYVSTTPVPNFIGSTIHIDNTRSINDFNAATRQGFRFQIIQVNASSEPLGTIVGQDPEPNKHIGNSDQHTINLIISGGQGTATIPKKISGSPVSEACASLVEAGLWSSACPAIDLDEDGGMVRHTGPKVTGTNPSAGTKVPAGSEVQITTQ